MSARVASFALVGAAVMTLAPATAVAADTGAPILSGAPPALTASTSASISYSADPGDSIPYAFLCAYDGDFSQWSECPPSPVTLSDLGDGTHSFSVKAHDMYGWQIGNVATVSWVVDTTAPSPPSVTSPLDGATYDGTSVPFIASGESQATLKCNLNGAGWVDCPKATGQTPGDKSRIPVGWDTILHWGEASDWTTMRWGQTNPDGSVQWNGLRDRSNYSGAFGDDAVTASRIVNLFMPLSCSVIAGLGPSMSLFIVAGLPDGSKWNSYAIDCSDSSLAEVPGPTPGEFTGLSAGSSNTLLVKAIDTAGNESASSEVSWNVAAPDTTAPDAPTLSNKPDTPTANTGYSIGFTLAESGGTVECSVDGGAWTACTSPITGSGLSDGEHSVKVRQTDAASNVGAEASHTWTVDTIAPDAPTLSNERGSLTNLKTASIDEMTPPEPGDTFECAFDSDEFSPCSFPWTASDLSVGSHTLKVRRSDAAGNTSSPAEATWEVAELAVAANPTISSAASEPLGVGTQVSGGGQSFSGMAAGYVEVYRWQRCSSSIANWCSWIPGATDDTYTTSAADVGKRLRLTVTLNTIEGATITARSSTSGIVVPTAAGPSSITLPLGASSPVFGRSLTAVGPTWTGGLPTGLALQYRWQRCPATATDSDVTRCASIPGQTGSTYVPTGADVGRKLRLLVGVSASGINVWAASSPSSLVIVRPVNTAVPTITLASGVATPRRLSRMTASQGTWTGLQGGAFSWAWQACTGSDPSTCSNIAGKRSSVLIPGTAQFGKRLRAAVTYRSPDGQLTTAYTALSQPVG